LRPRSCLCLNDVFKITSQRVSHDDVVFYFAKKGDRMEFMNDGARPEGAMIDPEAEAQRQALANLARWGGLESDFLAETPPPRASEELSPVDIPENAVTHQTMPAVALAKPQHAASPRSLALATADRRRTLLPPVINPLRHAVSEDNNIDVLERFRARSRRDPAYTASPTVRAQVDAVVMKACTTTVAKKEIPRPFTDGPDVTTRFMRAVRHDVAIFNDAHQATGDVRYLTPISELQQRATAEALATLCLLAGAQPPEASPEVTQPDIPALHISENAAGVRGLRRFFRKFRPGRRK
jgi:hypothetical protein